MTDPAERNNPIPRGTFDAESSTERVARDLTGAPLRSYIDELRARVESLPDDDASLTVPPDARPARWVANDIATALHAAAEIVPRSPSSPDSVLPPSMAPIADASLRNVRRPHEDRARQTTTEFDGELLATRPSHDRGRKSGRFVSPGALRTAPAAALGPIATALIDLINEERAQAESSLALAAPSDAIGALVNQPADVGMMVTPVADAHSVPHTLAPDVVEVAPESSLTLASRALLLFVTAWIAGATTVYFLLRG